MAGVQCCLGALDAQAQVGNDLVDEQTQYCEVIGQ